MDNEADDRSNAGHKLKPYSTRQKSDGKHLNLVALCSLTHTLQTPVIVLQYQHLEMIGYRPRGLRGVLQEFPRL